MAKPRVFISTDIGGTDNDDYQSLVHALLYADEMNIVGITHTAGFRTPVGSRAAILEVVDAYAQDYANLKTYGGYPTPDYLRSISHQGSTVAAPSAGWSKPTDGSQAIVKAAREASPSDPLYVLTWGGDTDVAQALHDAPDIAANIRLYTIGRQDPNAERYLMDNWKSDIWWVQSSSTARGIYADGIANRPTPGSDKWVAENAKGHGALGDLFDKMSHGLWDGAAKNDNGYGIKMGDTPSVLYVLDVIRTGRADPTAEGWGGEYRQTGTNYWTDKTDGSLRIGAFNGAATVAEDRAAILKDFAIRLDRADHPKSGSTPAPTPSTPTSSDATVKTSWGGSGNDTLKGGTGIDKMVGGAGNDTYYVDHSSDVVVENAYSGYDVVRSSVSYTLPANVQELILSGGASKAVGNEIGNLLVGTGGANVIEGRGGNDTIRGLGGDDSLSGGAGADKFVLSIGMGTDKITDFHLGEDKLDFSAFGGKDPVISDSNGSAVLSWGTDSVTLVGVTPGDPLLKAMFVVREESISS